MNLISIGRFSRLTGLSIRALRLYNAEGLLQPSLVDADTGYRYYTLEQLDTAGRIKLLRECEMPLDDIQVVLQDPKQAQQRMLKHRQHLEQRLKHHHVMLQVLDGVLKNNHQNQFDVQYRYSSAQPILKRSEQIVWAERSSIASSVNAVLDFVREHTITTAGAPFSMYPVPWRKRSLEISCCIPILGKQQSILGKQQSEKVEILEAAELAYTVHIGDYSSINLTLEKLVAWIAEQNHEIIGHVREIYLEHPLSVSDPSRYRTEIAIPIRRKSQGN